MIKLRYRLIACFFLVVSASYPQSSTDDPDETDQTASVVAQPKPILFTREGLIFRSADDSNQLKVHGYVQGDARFFQSDLMNQSHDTLLFRRVRPLVEGTVFKVLAFRFMPDFGENNAVIQEAYVELQSSSYCRIRAGKFKVPIGLQVLRSDRELTFAERSLASDLVPIRNVGVQMGGAVFRDSLSYELGYFKGTMDGTNGSFEWSDTSDVALRVFALPFSTASMKALKYAGLGIAWSIGQGNGALPIAKTAGQNAFFRYLSGSTADGEHQRLSPQAYYYYGPFGVLTEYTISSQQLRNGTNLRTISNRAWDVAASYVLTGEANSYAGVVPTHTFEPTKGWQHLGAWEIAVRHSMLHIDQQAFPLFADPLKSARVGNEWGANLNWYLNKYAKLVVDYEHTSFVMAVSNATPLHAENAVVTRLQLAF